MTYNHEETLNAALAALERGNLKTAVEFAGMATKQQPDYPQDFETPG